MTLLNVVCFANLLILISNNWFSYKLLKLLYHKLHLGGSWSSQSNSILLRGISVPPTIVEHFKFLAFCQHLKIWLLLFCRWRESLDEPEFIPRLNFDFGSCKFVVLVKWTWIKYDSLVNIELKWMVWITCTKLSQSRFSKSTESQWIFMNVYTRSYVFSANSVWPFMTYPLVKHCWSGYSQNAYFGLGFVFCIGCTHIWINQLDIEPTGLFKICNCGHIFQNHSIVTDLWYPRFLFRLFLKNLQNRVVERHNSSFNTIYQLTCHIASGHFR